MNYFLLIFIFCGLFGITIGAFTITTALKSRRWQWVWGVIDSSYVTSETGRAEDTTVFIPQVTYTYSLESKEYRGRRISSSDLGGDSNYAKKVIGKYPQGLQVKVFYNPDDNNDAVLEPGLKLSAFFPLMIGAAFLIPSLLCMFGVICGK
jgi:hypothetical protein